MVGLLRTSCVPGVSAAGPEISELSNRFTGNDATANTTRSGRRSWLKPSAALLGKRARVVKVTTREESSCSPMARHCSDQSIGRSVRRLTQKPRGSRPSIAASAKTEETRRIARARHPRGGVGRGPSRRRSGCGPGGRGRRRVRPRRPRPGRARRRASERQVLLETRVGGDARVDSAANGRSCRHASFAASIFSCLDDTKFHGVASCRPCAKSATLRPAAAKEHDMPEPTTSATDAAPAAVEDEPIRERVKKLTSQVLQQGRVDSEAVREVASAVLGRTPGSTAVTGAKAREFFAEAVRQLDDTLVKSASATHGALQQLASRGQDITDNDLKEALVSLRKLEEDYVAVSNRLADALLAHTEAKEGK